LLSDEILALKTRGMSISGITCDGATFQMKGLNFEDSRSIQSQNPHNLSLTRLMFIPWLCHHVNNAYHCLSRESRPFRDCVLSLRALAKFSRELKQRHVLGRACPQFIEAR
jgi:hypothetical protein